MLIVTDDGRGSTEYSKQVWRDNRDLFGRFVEAWVYERGDGPLVDGRLCVPPSERDGAWASPPTKVWPSPPTMVRIDDRGNELWLTGTLCGYRGEGPRGAEFILREEGFGAEAEAVSDEGFVKVVRRRTGAGAVTSEFVERGTRLWDGEDKIRRWLARTSQATGRYDRAREVQRLMQPDPCYYGRARRTFMHPRGPGMPASAA
jgi:hypothetical protein